MSDWEQLTFYPLVYISLGGLHPKNNSKWIKIFFCFNISYFTMILTLASIEIYIAYENDNIFSIIESILTIVLYSHMFSKYLIIYYHKPTLGLLLEKRSAFWKIDGNVENEVRIESQKIMKNANAVVKSYLGYSILVCISFLIQPFVTGQLPVFIYIPEGSFQYLRISFFLISPAIIASIWGVDTLIYSITMPVCVQFNLLAYEFENFDLNMNEKRLKILIDYHNFLIQYCNLILKMSSGIFFGLYLAAISTLCLQLFIASQPEFGLMNKIKCVTYFAMQITEIAMFCYMAEYISETSSNIGDAVYRSRWYHLNHHTLKRECRLVIARAQREVVFSGFGLIPMNMETFTGIFRAAMSFYTYLNTMVLTD